MLHSWIPVEIEENSTLIKVLNNIKEKCNFEGKTQALMVPINEPANRLTYYTGLPEHVIQSLEIRKKTTSLALHSRVSLLNLLKIHYGHDPPEDYAALFRLVVNSELRLIRSKDHADKAVTTLTEFIEEFNTLGFEIKELKSNKKIVIEKPEVRFERYMFLNSMKNIRILKAMHIVYIDERVISSDMKFLKPWVKNISTSLESEDYVFYHAVCINGFIGGLFTNQSSYKNFYKWVTEALLGSLKGPSVIVMDKNPLHGTPENVCPITMYSTKTEMFTWLIQNNIPCNKDMTKPELYNFITRVNMNKMEYKLDKFLQMHSHHVLRLPMCLYDLSITTPLWFDIIDMKQDFTDNNVLHFQSTLLDIIQNIPFQTWKRYSSSVESIENNLFAIDACIDRDLGDLEFLDS